MREPLCLCDTPQSLATEPQADPVAALDLGTRTGEATMGLHGCSSVAAFGGRPPQPSKETPVGLRSYVLFVYYRLFLFPENLPLIRVRKSSSLTEGRAEGNQDACSAHISYSPTVHHLALQLASPFPVLTAKPPLSAQDTHPLTGSLAGPSQVGL